MSRSARLQRGLMVVLVIAFALAMGWMLTHRKRGAGLSELPASTAAPGGPLTPPRFANLKAVHGNTGRQTHDGDTVSASDALDFEVEVAELCFLYVVSARGDETTVQWKPEPSTPWDRGAYAPMWNDLDTRGLPLRTAGALALYLVSAPLPLPDIDDWTPDQLANPKEKCPKCAVAVARFNVVDAAGAGGSP